METGRWDQSRTVVVSGVPVVLDVCRMIDKLTIHFQSRRRSDGGDVEAVTYPTNIKGVAFIAFDKAEDADRVVQKEQQIMTDSKFPEDYLLTVFPFTRDVFLYVVSATVDLFVFRSDLESLIQSLRSAHRSLRFQLLFRQRKATIEGPFAAIKALREDLMHRANQLKSTVPTAAIKLRESPLNPRVISHHGFVGSGSCSLSSLLRSTDEATEVQSLLSNAKTQNSARQKVGSFISTDSDKEELRAQLKVPSVKASPRTVLWEISAGIRSSLSDPDLLPAEKIASSQPEVDDISQDTISATKTWAGNHLGSRYSSSDNLTESHHSSSTKFLNTRLKDDLMSSECDAEYTEDLSADCSANPDSTCSLIDSYIFRYIEKFDKKELDRCLRGLDVYVEYVEGSDLIRICFPDSQSSQAASRIQQALENLKTLEDHWLSILRVHQICYNEDEQPRKQKLVKICKDLNQNIVFDDVLYMFEDSCIKIIGPSVSSHLFCKRVEDRLKDKK